MICVALRKDEVDAVRATLTDTVNSIVVANGMELRSLLASVRTPASPAPSDERLPPAAITRLSDGIDIDPVARELRVSDTHYQLSVREFDLLSLLGSRPGDVFSFEEILKSIWGLDYYGDAEAVTTTVKRLRRRLRSDDRIRISSIRGVGYRLDVADVPGS